MSIFDFKGLELLINLQDYDYSLDTWRLDYMFVGFLFQKEPFFYDHDNYDRVFEIAKVLGINKLNDYLNKYQIQTKMKNR